MPIDSDKLYESAMASLQEGQWQKAVNTLEELQNQQGDDSSLSSLLEYARLKLSLEQPQPEPISRRIPRLSSRATRRLAMAATFLLMAAIFALFYQQFLRPENVAIARETQINELIGRGETALHEGRYAEAIQVFNQALELAPTNEQAGQGLAESQRLQMLADSYDQAISLRDTGENERALALLREIESREPGFRDVSRLIEQIEADSLVAQKFLAAQQAFSDQQWAEAVRGYEEVRRLDATYQADLVRSNLLTSYIQAGRETLAQPNAGIAEVEAAEALFEKALSLQPGHPEARTERDRAKAFLQGAEQVEQQRWSRAITALETVYQERPDYAHGQAAELLYQAYLARGQEREANGDWAGALADYQAAAQLPADVDGAAAERAHAYALSLTPTPTATPTATPTPPPTPTPMPTLPPPPPTPSPLAWYPGWIVFKSNRGGNVGLYAMTPDGRNVRSVADMETYDKYYANEAWSPDGIRRYYVEGDSKVTAIYAWRYDVPSNWLEVREQVLDNSALNYDPVVSPDGKKIAFVSEKAEGDDIWLLNLGDPEPKRLTWNTWEWDKHPSWSPDGSQIVFWSNRVTGRPQIWVMNADGSNQHNISNNEYSDWDPIWVKELRPQAEETKNLP